MSNIFNEEDYLKILRNRFETKDIEFLEAERKSFSDDVEGFMGDHFILNITYKLNNLIGKESFFVKTLPKKSEYQMKLNEEFSTYIKETFVYGTLFEEFRKYGYDHSFAPRCYYCKNEETIVMENLMVKDFELYERGKSYDVDHCKEALKALAYYHANSIALEETKSKELGRVFRMNEVKPVAFKEVFFIPGDVDSPTTRFVNQTKECYKKLCQFVPESEEWKQKFYEKVDGFDTASIFYQPLKSRTTCTHGDLWSNNMLFKYENGVPSKCCLIDFQLVRYHHPVFDAVLVIHSNTDRGFRQKHFKTLMKFYYQTFCEILSGYGFNGPKIMPEVDFIEAGKALEPIAIIQAFSNKSIVYLPKNITNNLNEQESDVSFQDLIEKDRSHLVVECCKRDENIKKILIDAIYDLNDHL